MRPDQVARMIAGGESQTVEFKKSLSEIDLEEEENNKQLEEGSETK